MRPAQHPKHYGRIAKLSALWDLGGRLSSQGLLLVASVFLARLLSPADFGITAASRFFVRMATRLTQLGLNASLVRMRELRPEHASSVFVVNLTLGACVFLALLAASPAIGRFFDNEHVARVLPVTAAVFLITPFGSVAGAMLNRHLQYRKSAVIQWLDGVSGTVISVVLAWWGFGYWSLVLGALSGAVLSTAAKVYFSPWRPALRFSRTALRETLGFGLGFQTNRLLMFAAHNLDDLVIGKTLGVVALGYYDKGFGLMRQLTDRMSVDGALMRILRLIGDDADRLRRGVLKTMLASSMVSFPVLCFAALAADRIIIVLFGPQWEPAIGPFRVLALLGVLRVGLRAVHAANEALGKVWMQASHQAILVVLSISGLIVGSRWGLTAAAIGLVPGVLTYLTLSVALITRISDIRAGELLKALRPATATAGIVVATSGGVDLLLRQVVGMGTDSIPGLAALIVTAAVTHVGFVLWTPYEAVAAVLNESVDDVAPAVRRWVKVGALRQPVPETAENASAPGSIGVG